MFIASDARFICAYNIYANVEQKELHNFKKMVQLLSHKNEKMKRKQKKGISK